MTIGVFVTTSEAAPPGGVQQSTGTAFFAGKADKGSGTVPALCQSLNDYVNACGPRTSTSSALYDAVDTFFREGPAQAVLYVLNVTDNSASAATLTLNDQIPEPSVVVTAQSPGTAGNTIFAAVTVANAATFTGSRTSSSPNITAISSFANIGAGTPISGTGIAAGTYLLSVNPGAGTAVMSANATSSSSSALTPTNFTVAIEDSSGDVLETHGPYVNTAALYGDTSSALVTFTQSAGSGFTIQNPATKAATALAGGADASDLTDTIAVTTLAGFSPALGPGTVALPGYTSSTAWNGLLSHAQANNRLAALDLPDSSSATTQISAIGQIGAQADAQYGVFTASSCKIPGTSGTPNVSRTVCGSAVVAALRAQVAETGNDNQNPSGINWGLTYVTGFTNTFNTADINSLNAGGVNPWTIRQNVLCLFGFVTPVPPTTDLLFWQANVSAERMALVAEAAQIAEPFLFKAIDGRGHLAASFGGELQGLIQQHWSNDALFGDTALDAGSVNVGPPVNTPTTAQNGQLNAQMKVRPTESAQTINLDLNFVPLSQSVA